MSLAEFLFKKKANSLSEELIIKTICLDLEYWDQWKENFKLEDIDVNSYQLLPSLFKHLENQRYSEVNTLSGIYRKNFTNSKLKIDRALNAINSLNSKNIKAVFICETACALHPVNNFGSTIIDNVKILIDPTEAENALQLLKDHGWGTNIKSTNKNIVKYYSSAPFWNSTVKGKIILQWNCDEKISSKELLDRTLNNSQEINYEGKKLLIPSDQELLAFFLLQYPNSVWILNSVLFIKNIKEVNWKYIFEIANRPRLKKTLIQMLNYLHSELKVIETETAVDRNKLTLSCFEYLPNILKKFVYLYQDKSLIEKVTTFVPYLVEKYNYRKSIIK